MHCPDWAITPKHLKIPRTNVVIVVQSHPADLSRATLSKKTHCNSFFSPLSNYIRTELSGAQAQNARKKPTKHSGATMARGIPPIKSNLFEHFSLSGGAEFQIPSLDLT